MAVRWMRAVLLLAWLVAAIGPAPARASSVAKELLDRMTPEERVGQLFLVTFQGMDVGPGSPIQTLIREYHVGGVVLLRNNDNFGDGPQASFQTQVLIADLQNAAWGVAQSGGTYVPLFIGLSQEGGGYPHDQILSGLTPLPAPMAIGATWQPDLARQAGEVLGAELSALGVNLLLGPSLDVLESPGRSISGDLGTRVFGGDPYWVGRMGQAYIEGLHAGGNDRLLVIAKHFPGRGSSDRPPEDEIATVRKSLEQLKQIELAPFFAVTGNAPSDRATADGLLVSHIRYQGLQGNIRANTRPVSFDSSALAQIMALPAFAEWRAPGGLLVSDDLGSRAVREYYDPTGASFVARFAARDAFLAGNDLLYLGNIVSSDRVDVYQTTVEILDFFVQKYEEDPAFALRVDQAVLRILQAKLRLYGEFTPERVLYNPDDLRLQSLGGSGAVVLQIAQQSATLISPSLFDLSALLPVPPSGQDRLVFLTDTAEARPCSACAPQSVLGRTDLQQAVLRLYGPAAGGEVQAGHLSSYTFQDVQALLAGSAPYGMEADLRQADYIVLLLRQTDAGQPALIRRFLSERQDLLRERRVILFAFCAPYYLDATDISHLTAYYALYSTGTAFIETAARLLFQEANAPGASPVSVPGVGYDLIAATAPDPSQVIELALDLPDPPPGSTPGAVPEPVFRPGDSLAVRTSVIRDHNGNPVPDGTVVVFTLTLPGEGGGVIQQVETVTSGGVARTSFRIDRAGLLEVRVQSEPARLSQVLQLDVTGGPAAVTIIAPPVAGTQPPGAAVAPTEAAPASGWTSGSAPGPGAWLMMVIFVAGGSLLAYWAGDRLRAGRWGLRWALCVALGGLAGYTWLALGLPGAAPWLAAQGMMAVYSTVLAGMLAGLAGAGFWAWRAGK